MWTVKAISKNVHEIAFENIAAGWEQDVLLTSDRHWDNPHSLQWLQKEHLERAKQVNAPIIDIGDLFCVMQGRYDPRRSQDSLRQEHQGDDYFNKILDTSEEWFAPYADQFAVIGRGNHETSVRKNSNLDLTKEFCRRMRRRSSREDRSFSGGYGGYIIFRFTIQGTVKRRIVMKYYHGSGGGGPVTKGTIQAQRRAATFPSADIVVSGHIHEAWLTHHRQEILTRTGRIHLRTQKHLSLPTYKEEYAEGAGGFHVERGRPPKPIGCGWLSFKMTANSTVGMNPRLELHDG